jgi:hypothetical protein
MYYDRVMGYDMHFPANQLGGPKKVWTIREYGLSQVRVKAETTVPTNLDSTWKTMAHTNQTDKVYLAPIQRD